MDTARSDTQATTGLGFFMDVEGQFQDAIANKLIAPAAGEIYATWLKHGRPQEPDGPHTDVHGNVAKWLDADDIPGVPLGTADQCANQYNAAQLQLLELTGIWHAGGDCWHTHWNRGSQAWEQFIEQAAVIASEYINKRLWDVFCASLPEE